MILLAQKEVIGMQPVLVHFPFDVELTLLVEFLLPLPKFTIFSNSYVPTYKVQSLCKNKQYRLIFYTITNNQPCPFSTIAS